MAVMSDCKLAIIVGNVTVFLIAVHMLSFLFTTIYFSPHSLYETAHLFFQGVMSSPEEAAYLASPLFKAATLMLILMSFCFAFLLFRVTGSITSNIKSNKKG